MIALIRGEIFDVDTDSFIILTGGIGYRVYTPLNRYAVLPQPGDEVTLYTHYYLREDSALLFGFESQKELTLFELLININGVGRKTALLMLNAFSYDQLLQSMRTGSVNQLTKIPGIGKKTAERILLEMKDKLDALEPPQEKTAVEEPSEGETVTGFHDKNLAVTALAQLGYSVVLAEKYVDRAVAEFSEPVTIEQLITAALQVAAKG